MGDAAPDNHFSWAHAAAETIRREIGRLLVGQDHLVDSLLVGLFCRGHMLIEGVPGLAKTLAVHALAGCVDADFKRIQFTPDLLPADLVGTEIYRPREGEFTVRKGPVFNNIILADEINRAPSKVQSALLEAMQERQVTIGEATFPLPEPFMVLATQNPIEQEGTYPLPEAQVDRFMLKLSLDYPSRSEEKEILVRMGFEAPRPPRPVVSAEEIDRIHRVVGAVHMDDRLQDYLVDIVCATRRPTEYGIDVAPLIRYGASPRATIFIARAARAHALIAGQTYVTPQEIKQAAVDVLRHRIILTYEAEAEEVTGDQIVGRILAGVEVP